MRKIFNFFKKLFFRRRKRPIDPPESFQKAYEEILKAKEEEIQKESEEYWKKRRLKEERKKNERLSYEKIKKVKSVVEHEAFIVKPQIVSIPQIKELFDGVEYRLKGKTFIFDRNGYRLFEEDFKNDYYNIIIQNGYLARQHKERDFIKEFHRWLMEEEVKRFAEVNKYPIEDIQVHHIDLTTTNNRKNNLDPMTKEEHKELHVKLKSRRKFKGTDEEFEKWYAKKANKEKESQPEHY